MFLTQQDVLNYERDGFVLVPDVFSGREVELMIREIEGGARVRETRHDMADASGKKAGLAIWNDLGDDLWAAASTHPRIVNSVRILMGEEIAFFHGKVMLKEANSGGAWEWHQDYGYWYNEGFLFPRMLSAFVAVDRATKENGCLQVLRGSHKLGRLNHGQVGNQAGADAKRIEELERRLERLHVEMAPGSVLFFDCNLLHTSASNNSPHPRRSFIVCYNALANPCLSGHHRFETPCPVASDDAILKFA